MFKAWHWSGIRGVLRTYYKINYSAESAEQVLQLCERTLTEHGGESEAREGAIAQAKRLRSCGCDKASAYVAAACSYSAFAFALDPDRCSAITEFLQDSIDNDDLLHPLAAKAVHTAKKVMLAAIAETYGYDQEADVPDDVRASAGTIARRGRDLLKERRRAARS